MARKPRTPKERAVLEELGRRVAALRDERGLSQERLAELSGIDRTHIGTLEHGNSEMSVLKVWQLAKGLDVDPADLVRGLDRGLA
jgi:transcriptional regulator with XRE-family HTH domain